MATELSATTPEKPSQNSWHRRLLLLAGPVVLVVGGIFLYLRGGREVVSDNAYVHAGKLTVTSEVTGVVREVAVRDNEHVQPGQLLFKLDDEVQRLAVAEATAQLNSVRLDLATLRSSYQEKLAAIEEANEQTAFAARVLQRQQSLSAANAATSVELDEARHTVDAARGRVAVLQREAATVVASLGGLDCPEDQNPRIVEVRTQLDRAQRDLRRTVVLAPVAGIVTNAANLPVGKYLQSGQPAFSIISTTDVWLEANLKETELAYLKSGNPVTIAIDAYPQAHWSGTVLDIGPATGSEFALIPAQNASGNWVKTVQRVPVRVKIEQDPAHPLRAGMSAHVRIDTGHVRSLRDLAWW